jgi:hypothetical protein
MKLDALLKEKREDREPEERLRDIIDAIAALTGYTSPEGGAR